MAYGLGLVDVGWDRGEERDVGRVEKILVLVMVVMVMNHDSEYEPLCKPGRAS